MNESLLAVTTISEAAECWSKNPDSIRRAIDSRRNPLQARLSGCVWLISVASLRRRWGPELKPLSIWPANLSA